MVVRHYHLEQVDRYQQVIPSQALENNPQKTSRYAPQGVNHPDFLTVSSTIPPLQLPVSHLPYPREAPFLKLCPSYFTMIVQSCPRG
jgi:hypothetical protein